MDWWYEAQLKRWMNIDVNNINLMFYRQNRNVLFFISKQRWWETKKLSDAWRLGSMKPINSHQEALSSLPKTQMRCYLSPYPISKFLTVALTLTPCEVARAPLSRVVSFVHYLVISHFRDKWNSPGLRGYLRDISIIDSFPSMENIRRYKIERRNCDKN